MQRKFHFRVKDTPTASTSASANDRSTRVMRGNLFPKKLVGSVFSNVSGNKRSLGNYPFKGKKNEPHVDWGDRREWHITKTSSRELRNSLECGDGEAVERKQNRKDKMNLPLLNFLDKKKKRWNHFIKAKTRKFRVSSNVHDVVIRFGQVRRKLSSWRVVKIIPLKILIIRLKLKLMKSLMKKNVTKQFEQVADGNGNDDEDLELCKKRILMGGRCKPLSSSGTLRYDKDGLYLPEIVP